MALLWHHEQPIGICVFVAPPISLSLRNQFFGRRGSWNRTSVRLVNRQLVLLQRVVLHPTYRGAGIATKFVRRACELCGYPWIETMSQMGHINPFFEKAGFVRVGIIRRRGSSRRGHTQIYGGHRRHAKTPLISEETYKKSRHARPVYYIFDNRNACRSGSTDRS